MLGLLCGCKIMRKTNNEIAKQCKESKIMASITASPKHKRRPLCGRSAGSLCTSQVASMRAGVGCLLVVFGWGPGRAMRAQCARPGRATALSSKHGPNCTSRAPTHVCVQGSSRASLEAMSRNVPKYRSFCASFTSNDARNGSRRSLD